VHPSARGAQAPRRGLSRARAAAALAALLAGSIAAVAADAPDDPWREARERMVREQVVARGVRAPRVLAALRGVPRHEFVPTKHRSSAYTDEPLPIGEGQTISQPYIVAAMTEALALGGDERVLEIGTGSGYQAAILAELAREVYTIEIVKPLADSAKERLGRLGYGRVHVRHGDGWRGWPSAAPFDAIVVTAAPVEIPQALVDQLAEGGRLVLPVGDSEHQELLLLVREPTGIRRERLMDVRFVPLTRSP
jgi:protein-L-isoaspartate(D-aspartate) O-methyltransferase